MLLKGYYVVDINA